ncbi:hypothetical protein AXE65_06875 [Ventosimonas gracilis]|uniref:LysM domain-containing protein n=1 Tax=Ventosimonas gracilis TaxID=1680762 RepID=A0A139SJ60_9GAMM|nr:hypothetical protein AXE65_06875 [Ventosimonas gracilis]
MFSAFWLSACTTTSRAPTSAKVRVIPKVMHGQYVVRRGDTLYSIARRHGWDWKALAAHNRIGSPYRLKVGQIIRFDNRPLPRQTPASAPRRSTPPPRQTASKPPATPSKPKPSVSRQPAKTTNPPPRQTPPAAGSAALSAIQWRWPTDGTLIARFAANNGLNKGIDIAGKAGQPVKAAADGLVTYAGNGLYGNGEALVIKHGTSLVVSVYGHNRRLLVKEGQQVKAGQVIAEMGASGTDRVKLHFEIRYQSQAVDPLLYLPKR